MTRHYRDFRDGEAFFLLPDDLSVPFGVLSDGFRAYLSWVGDLLRHLGDVAPADQDPAETSGVVLVDEVDLHLHPSWQRVLLESLAGAFPRLQFIVTSHSPILAGCLPPENILVVERHGKGPATLRLADEDLYGRSVTQILRSPYFSMTSTLPPALESEEKAHQIERERRARAYLEKKDDVTAEAYLEAIDETDRSFTT